MSWTNKVKIPQGDVQGDIVTPDFLQILVGSSEDLVLVWQLPYSNWNLKSKTAAGSWSLKSKTIS